MATENIPPNVRKRLAVRLKELRGDRRQEDVVRALQAIPGSGRWSVTKLSRMENDQARVQPDVVEDLLTIYGHDDPEELARLKLWARAARDKGYWQKGRRGLPDNMADFGEYEDRAVVQRVWEPLLVPGLCQSEGYARAVISGIEPSIDHDELERRVATRMARQAVLSREDPQELWVLLDERVLRARIGSVDVRLEQLRRLVELASWSNVTLQVVAADAGGAPRLVRLVHDLRVLRRHGGCRLHRRSWRKPVSRRLRGRAALYADVRAPARNRRQRGRLDRADWQGDRRVGA
ncbi:hypothetical protein FHX81_6170 [Saccharothrix saharensis]|uniref:DUF5753 domain-containing protein n=1 Tax=Saccharothrix saharensis TaxID=571190 RepID=A0A543JLQ8_9PSEU|nr:DUF5753 domain-containing protein [Saccharothrix saharensis]TQM83743.1 hypothetical protein FHX81_6170 [Saccharothrix saharensis]